MIVMYFVGTGSLIVLVFAAFMSVRVRREPGGNPEVLRISGAVQKGASTYLRHQYKDVGTFSTAAFVILLVMAFCGSLSFFAPFAFPTGGFPSGLSGFIGIRTATMASCWTAQGTSRNLNKGLRVVFSADSVIGFTVAGLDPLDLTAWYFILNMVLDALPNSQRIAQITANILTFGMGAFSAVLLARMGGGTFTKAADVDTNLVGKVEAGIPEDDPRNSAVIADDVGDNVGNMAGMGAGLYESYVGSIVFTTALAVTAGYGGKGMTIPMILAVLGMLTSILGTFFVRAEEDVSQKNLLEALRMETYTSAALAVAIAYTAICTLLPDRMGIHATILSRLAAGVLIGAVTEYYTSGTYNPTKKLAAFSQTGGATIIINGLSLDMLSTVTPVVIVGVSVLISYYCSGDSADFNVGLYGMGIPAVGMLSTLGITPATDAYGPVADNAGGIAEMTHMSEEIRQRAGALDSLGNTTAATGKGFATGPAAPTALTLVAFYTDKVKQIDPSLSMDPLITNPTVLIGLFIGGMLPFLPVALTMEAVDEAARSIVAGVRRQFREIKGLMEGGAEPDYGACVDMCTISVQRPTVAPAMVVVIIPVAVGPPLGSEGVSGLLVGNAVTGFVLAVMMVNVEGAWGNAKKYIRSGQLGGRGSEEHKAAVMDDTAGDPFKDTSGPSINILVKLTSMVSIVSAGLIMAVHLL